MNSRRILATMLGYNSRTCYIRVVISISCNPFFYCFYLFNFLNSCTCILHTHTAVVSCLDLFIYVCTYVSIGIGLLQCYILYTQLLTWYSHIGYLIFPQPVDVVLKCSTCTKGSLFSLTKRDRNQLSCFGLRLAQSQIWQFKKY